MFLIALNYLVSVRAQSDPDTDPFHEERRLQMRVETQGTHNLIGRDCRKPGKQAVLALVCRFLHCKHPVRDFVCVLRLAGTPGIDWDA